MSASVGVLAREYVLYFVVVVAVRVAVWSRVKILKVIIVKEVA